MDVNDELGTLERDGELCVLRYRRVLPQRPETVWRALTEDAHLAGWFPTTIEGERSPGAPLRFSFRNGEAPQWRPGFTLRGLQSFPLRVAAH